MRVAWQQDMDFGLLDIIRGVFFKAFGGLYFICFAMIRGVTNALG